MKGRLSPGPVRFDVLESTCYIEGRFDVVVEFDDGAYGLMDFKTGNPGDGKTGAYAWELHA